MSSPFPFLIGYILDYTCHSGSLSNDGVADSNGPSTVFHSPDVSSLFPFHIGYVLGYVCLLARH